MANTTDLDDIGEFGVPAHVIQKNKREQIRIGMGEFKGREYIDIRTYFSADDGWRPTGKGVTLSPDGYEQLLRGVLELGAQLGRIDESLLLSLDGMDQNAEPPVAVRAVHSEQTYRTI